MWVPPMRISLCGPTIWCVIWQPTYTFRHSLGGQARLSPFATLTKLWADPFVGIRKSAHRGVICLRLKTYAAHREAGDIAGFDW